MRTLTDFVLRHKLVVCLSWLLVAVAGVLVTPGLSKALTADFSQPGQPGYEANQRIVDRYGSGGAVTPQVVVVRLPPGSTADDPALGRAFAAAADAVRGRAVSYADTRDPALLADSGRVTYGLVWASDRRAVPVGVVRAALPAGSSVQVTGLAQLTDSGGGRQGLSILTEVLIGAVGALVVLAFVFGSSLAALPVLLAGIAILGSFLLLRGLAELTEVNTVVQFVVALIGLGVSIDYALLIVTRWREERASTDNVGAVRRAMLTAGRSVLVSGVSVAIGLVAMVLVPVPVLRSIGLGGILIPLVSVLLVLTLLPVLLATAGPRLDWPHRPVGRNADRRWSGWARLVLRHRWAAAAAGLVVLLALAGAASGLRLGDPGTESSTATGPAAAGLQALRTAGVPTGVLAPIEVLAGDSAADALREIPGVVAVVTSEPGLLEVLPADEPSTDAGAETLRRVRDAVPESAQVGGPAAQSKDAISAIYDVFPLMLGLIALVTFAVLTRAFGSVVLAVKAVLLNLLSLAASLGALVLIWQYGYGSQLLGGLPALGSITEFIPAIVFAFLYGLSMDYEIFLLARIREEYDRTGSTPEAVVGGLGSTGRLVTSAALILALAFASLAAAPATELKVFASALAIGILLDATVVRALLVPALIGVLGSATWWSPQGLRATTTNSL
ncbi:MMPL family transporter [Cryptosporangium phraense]|uniref:MMPL family transporter n=1 Tax=Cryptosporangium phraense TaxID=2593070 RepID=A0A545AZI7_9ACTN|nr:MMPL family transporter [Cryptosporangium phraense]TQS46751.1 MMPL family transporter [Cryptosporangium phraense]